MKSSTVQSCGDLVEARRENLADGQIEQLLHAAFSPHRCVVRFGSVGADYRRKVSVHVFVWTGARADEREFVVEGVSLDALRAPNALADYVSEVRRHLQQRRVVFGPLSFAQSLAYAREHVARHR